MKTGYSIVLAASLLVTSCLSSFSLPCWAQDSETTVPIESTPASPVSPADAIKTESSGAAQPELTGENAFVDSADEKWRKLIYDGNELLKNDKPAINTFRRALSQSQKVQDEKLKSRMTAICKKKIGQAYAQKQDYLKADTILKEAGTAYTELGIEDQELTDAIAEVAKHYRVIEFPSLGDTVNGYLKDAGVTKIVVFRSADRDLIEINLTQKYIRAVDSKDVPKVSFNKKVSFELLTKPNGDYQVSKIQGLQVYAKSLWVNLIESILKVGGTPVAEVTAGKMGVTKTVSINVPQGIFGSTKEILDNLISAIKGQPAQAATIPSPAESGRESLESQVETPYNNQAPQTENPTTP